MFSKWFGKKSSPATHQSDDVYNSHFQVYGVIGELGGFQSHLSKIFSDTKLPISDKKYRNEKRSNVLGPLYANRSLRGHIHPVISTSWSDTDPTLLVSVGKDSRVMTWNISDASKTAEYLVDGDMLMACAVDSSNKLVVVGGLGFRCYALKRNQETGVLVDSGVTLDDHEGFIASCAFVGDTQVLTGSGDYTSKLFDLSKPTDCALRTFQHENEVMSVTPCLLPDHSAQTFYTSSGSLIQLWDVRESSTAKASLTITVPSGTDISSLDVCKQKDHVVACGTESGDCYVYDTRGGAGKCAVACVDRDITQAVASVALSYSGNLLFAGYRKWVKNYMDCVMMTFDLQNSQWETNNPTFAVCGAGDVGGGATLKAGAETEPIIAPHCVIGCNVGITSTIPFSYSYQHCTGTFMSSVRLNCDGCALSAASHDGSITVFRQQR